MNAIPFSHHAVDNVQGCSLFLEPRIIPPYVHPVYGMDDSEILFFIGCILLCSFVIFILCNTSSLHSFIVGACIYFAIALVVCLHEMVVHQEKHHMLAYTFGLYWPGSFMVWVCEQVHPEFLFWLNIGLWSFNVLSWIFSNYLRT